MKRLLIVLLGFGTLSSAQTESFTIREAFGVSHPRQIIDFDLHSKPDPAKKLPDRT